MNNYIIVYPDELNHFGVKGMKWGVRKTTNNPPSSRKQKIVKAAKVGAVVAATGLAIYGGYKAHKLYEKAVDTLIFEYKLRGEQALHRYSFSKTMAKDASLKATKEPLEVIARHYSDEAKRHTNLASQYYKDANTYLGYVNKRKYPKREVAKTMINIAKGYPKP